MSHKMNRLLMLIAVFGTAAAPLYAQQGVPVPTVAVEKAILLKDTEVRKYVGHIEAIQSVSLQARISGVIYEIRFKEGELVKKGDLLFVIEDTTYRAKAKSAEATVLQNRAELDYARTDFARQERLYEKKAVSQAVFEEAKRLLKTTEAKLAQAEANLLDCNNELSYTKIYAPITGIISKATYTVGNYVTPSSSPLADIVQVTPIYVRFAISERDFLKNFGTIPSLRKNAIVRIQLPDGRTYDKKGKVALTDNKVDSDTGSLTLWAEFENPNRVLVPGGYATVLLSSSLSKPLPAVKLSAVMTTGQGNLVYVIGADNKVIARPVVLGPVINNMQAIEKGVAVGETVVVDGTHKARSGSLVAPVPAK